MPKSILLFGLISTMSIAHGQMATCDFTTTSTLITISSPAPLESCTFYASQLGILTGDLWSLSATSFYMAPGDYFVSLSGQQWPTVTGESSTVGPSDLTVTSSDLFFFIALDPSSHFTMELTPVTPPVITAPSDTPAGTTCFSAEDVVFLEDGGMKRMGEIKIGDRILSSNRAEEFEFSPVVLLPYHTKANSILTTFIEIETTGGKKARMTPSHLIPIGGTGELVTARTLTVGSSLRTVDGIETILAIRKSSLRGIYTAVTEMEFIVVSGVVASPFGAAAGSTTAVFNTEDINSWCSSRRWQEANNYTFVNSTRRALRAIPAPPAPSADCLALAARLYENYKDEPVGWGINGWGYRGWTNPVSLG